MKTENIISEDTKYRIPINPALQEYYDEAEEFLRRLKIEDEELYSRTIIKGAKASDIVKYMKYQELTDRWRASYLHTIREAIYFIVEAYVEPFKFPEIEEQTQEDRILSKVLKNAGNIISNLYNFPKNVSLTHVIFYLERDEIIYNWTAIFLIQIQENVREVKAFLLKDEKQVP